MGKLRVGVTILTTFALGACGNAAMRAAERGSRAELAAELQGPYARGEVSNAEAADLARAVATREVLEANGEAAEERVRDLTPCAAEISGLLERRMQTHDRAGGEAALALQGASELSDGVARRFVTDPEPTWRAVGARTLWRQRDQKARRAAMRDPEPRVRQNALRASAEAHDPTDLDALFEIARVDPDPLARSLAVHAVSSLAQELEDQERLTERAGLAARLRDVWNATGDAGRHAVALAWSRAPIFDAGGREALRIALAEGAHPGAIAAAGVVVGAVRPDPELVASAEAILERTIRAGSTRDRVHAMIVARADGPMREALRAAASDPDPEVRVTASGRLLGSKADHQASLEALRTFAGQGTKASPTTDPRTLALAIRARLLLAHAGDLPIQAWIEQDLLAPTSTRRLSAATALAALGRSGRAAPLLADDDAHVRTAAACTMMLGR